MNIRHIVIPACLSLSLSSVYAGDLTDDDMSQCHQYSSLAAKYQAANQAHKTLDEALEGVDDQAERSLASEIYSAIDPHYGVAQIKMELFKHCVKSFAQMRESERKS
jgi:hypothetical protein